MTQAATALVPEEGCPSGPAPRLVLEDVEFRRPIVVTPGGTAGIRVAALRRADGVDVVIRSSDTSFQADHFSATLRWTTDEPDVPASVDPVADGRAAIQFLRSYEYAVVILDWRMPGLTGLEVLQWMRRRESPAAVLMLTARDAPADRVTGLDEGADDYLVKPFDFAELLARMRALQRRPRGLQAPKLVIGDVSVLDERLESTHPYSQVPAFSAADRAMLDVLTTTRSGRLAVIELKADEDIHLPLQGLDYWSRVQWHHARGEFPRFGYFPGKELSLETPLLFLVAAALHVHPATDTLLRYVSPEIEWEFIGIGERWREEVKVVFRKRAGARSHPRSEVCA